MSRPHPEEAGAADPVIGSADTARAGGGDEQGPDRDTPSVGPEGTGAAGDGRRGPGDDGDGDDGQGSGVDAPRRFAAVAARVDRTRSFAIERFETLEQRWPPVKLARTFVSRYLEVNGVVLSGHLAFRSFTFLLPLAFVVVAIAGLATNFGYDPGTTASSQLGLGQALGDSLRSAGNDTSAAPYHVAFVALLGLVLGALGMLSGLNYVFAQAWQVSQRKVEGKVAKLWRLVVALLFLTIVIVGSSAMRKSGFILGAASTLFVGGAFFCAFLGLGMIMPRRSTHWYWLVPGAIVGTVGLIGLQIFASFYLPDHLSTLSNTYGTLAIAVVLLSYLFLVGQIVVASAIADAVWYDHRNPEDAAAWAAKVAARDNSVPDAPAPPVMP